MVSPNLLERSVETLLGYPVDWDATGGWVGAAMSAAAVFLAWALANTSAQRHERARQAARLRALLHLYEEADWIFDTFEEACASGNGGTGPRPADPKYIDHITGALAGIDPLDLPHGVIVADLMMVRRLLVDAHAGAAAWGTDQWDAVEAGTDAMVGKFGLEGVMRRLSDLIAGRHVERPTTFGE